MTELVIYIMVPRGIVNCVLKCIFLTIQFGDKATRCKGIRERCDCSNNKISAKTPQALIQLFQAGPPTAGVMSTSAHVGMLLQVTNILKETTTKFPTFNIKI